MRPKCGAIGETLNAIAGCLRLISPISSGSTCTSELRRTTRIRAIGKERGQAASSYAGGVRILHGADHLGLMEFQQQKVSSRCRGRDRSIERVKAKGPHGKR